MLAARRARGAQVRDLTDASGPAYDASPPRSPGRWLVRIGVQLAVVAAIGSAILLVPPLISCRDRARAGFFVGDSYEACARRAVSDRMTAFDQEVRKIVLGSGR